MRARHGSKADRKGEFIRVWRLLKDASDPDPVGDAESGEKEYQFARASMGRGWRFDWTWADERVAVEVDGGQRMVRRNKRGGIMVGGRHNTDSDREKRNAAAELGWRVLTYTPEMIKKDPQGVVAQVKRTLESARRSARHNG